MVTFRLPLLVSSRPGYQNLCRLITKMKLRAKKGEGAVCGEELRRARPRPDLPHRRRRRPPRRSLATRRPRRSSHAKSINSIGIFGPDNVYVELQRHFQREEESRNRAAIDHRSFAESSSARHQWRLLRHRPKLANFATHSPRSAITALFPPPDACSPATPSAHLKSPQEMQQLFADLPEAIANTLELSSRLEFTLNDLGYEFPRYPVPEGETMNSFLRDRAWEGFRQRYGRASHDMQTRARRQIEKELALIEKLKLAGYFLIVWDLVRYCREQNILVQGRGSAANSAVCYSLGITAVDAVGMELALRTLPFRRARRVA